MNRRGFLGTMLAACSAPAIVRAESLMRVSGIVIPSAPSFGEMVFEISPGNTLLTPSIVARECLAMLEHHLTFAQTMNHDWQSETFLVPASTIRINRPPRFA